ncbi:hypothetical protein [Pseudonocardia sp.]|uniref:hypothetical protein n=1 Tax=Pseudonocardia sp. TaxID=60912 RepID=UPI003D0A7072
MRRTADRPPTLAAGRSVTGAVDEEETNMTDERTRLPAPALLPRRELGTAPARRTVRVR